MGLVVFILFFTPFIALAYFSWKKFWFLFSVNISILILFAAIGGISGYRPVFSMFFLLLFPCGAFFVIFNFVAIFKFWETYGVLTLVPVILCISSFKVSDITRHIGIDIRMKIFNENLPLYEEAVKELTPMIDEKGLYLAGDQIPQKYRKLAYLITVGKDNGIAFIFIWDFGFPLKHSAFVYRSDGSWPPKGSDFSREWPYYERINKNWFRASD